MTPPSDDYALALELSKDQHAKSKTYSGKFLRPQAWRIKEMIDRFGCKSVLDYGCGKGRQYDWVMPNGLTIEQYWGVPVTKYDPAYPPFAAEPVGTFDLVICTHVLGIIPEADLEWVVDRIYALANKAVFIALDTGSKPKEKKARWRVGSIPKDWDASDWFDLLSRRKNKDIEVRMIVRSDVPTHMTGEFRIGEAT